MHSVSFHHLELQWSLLITHLLIEAKQKSGGRFLVFWIIWLHCLHLPLFSYRFFFFNLLIYLAVLGSISTSFFTSRNHFRPQRSTEEATEKNQDVSQSRLSVLGLLGTRGQYEGAGWSEGFCCPSERHPLWFWSPDLGHLKLCLLKALSSRRPRELTGVSMEQAWCRAPTFFLAAAWFFWKEEEKEAKKEGKEGRGGGKRKKRNHQQILKWMETEP